MAVVNRFLAIFINKWVFIVIVVALVGYGIFSYSQNKENEVEQIYTVASGSVSQAVLLSGTIEAVDSADLAFGIAGKVENIFVEQGDVVEKGHVLAELDLDILRADLQKANGDLQSAEANIQVAQASVRKAMANLDLVRAAHRGDTQTIASLQKKLDNTQAEQAVLVANAKREFLENDLQVYPELILGTLPSLLLTGSYKGNLEGAYNFRLYISSQSNIGYSLLYSGLETGEVHFRGFDTPEPIGTHGLFIAFPSSGAGLNYNNTLWTIPIPNDRSATFQAKSNLFEKAQANANLAVSNVEADLDKLLSQEQEGTITLTTAEEDQALASLDEARGSLAQAKSSKTQALAALARVEAQLNDGIITAPFDGTIARIGFTVGETVGASEKGITLITDGNFELIMSVPEIDISKINIADDVSVSLDVYGNDVNWEGILRSIELVETEVDGVPVYESTVMILASDDRIRVGMNGRARIELARVDDVLVVPLSYLEEEGGTYTATIRKSPELVEERVVEIGLRGTNNFVEIKSGLDAEDVIIHPREQ